MRRPPHLVAFGVGHVVGTSIMVAPAYSSVGATKSFLVASESLILILAAIAVAGAQLYKAASPKGKVAAAVAKAMEPFEPALAEDEVINRSVMDTIKHTIKTWGMDATIIGGRFQSGRSVAVEEALRGVRGVVPFTIHTADWEKLMFERL